MTTEYGIKKLKIPSYYSWHWDNGKPAAMVTDGNKPPDFTPGWILVFHPEQELEISEKGLSAERMRGAAVVAKTTFDKFIPIGQKLSWRQRLRGIA